MALGVLTALQSPAVWAAALGVYCGVYLLLLKKKLPDGHSLDAEPPGGLDDAAGDLTAVGHENAAKHGLANKAAGAVLGERQRAAERNVTARQGRARFISFRRSQARASTLVPQDTRSEISRKQRW